MTMETLLSDDGLKSLISCGLTSCPRGVSIIAVDAASEAAADAVAVSSASPSVGTSRDSWSSLSGSQFGRVIFCNDAFAAMCGRSTQEVLGSTFDMLIGPDTDPEQVARLREALHNQQADTVQLRCYHSSGSTFWNSMTISPIPHANTSQSAPSLTSPSSEECNISTSTSPPSTAVTCFLTLHHDVSSIISEMDGFRLRDLALHRCSEGITLVDPNQPDMPVVFVNDAFLDMTGYTRDQVIGRNCRFLQGPGTDPDAVAELRSALAQHRKCTVQLLNYRQDKTHFWNMLSVTPVFDSRGRLSSYIGVQSDITELVMRKEEERRASEAKVTAENAMEAKSMFLANMSHEIRTPLNGMMAMAQLLLTSVLSPEQRDLAETILESGTSLLGILGDILDFSKLDQGSVELQHQAFSIRDTVEACIEMVAGDSLKKGLQIAYLLEDGDLAAGRPLLGDSVRVRQIIANLLSNAVKFTEQGDVVVTVQVEAPGFSLRRLAARQRRLRQNQQQQQGGPASCGACGAVITGIVASAGSMQKLLFQRSSSSGLSATTTSATPCSACRTATTASHGTASSTSSNTWHQSSASGGLGGGGNGGCGSSGSDSHNALDDASSCSSSNATVDSDSSTTSELAMAHNCDAPAGSYLTDSKAIAALPPPCSSKPVVHISVADSGIGISAAQAARLFQCFKQGSETMDRRYGGTGLGLAISQRLTQLMGGEIWVESQLGKGATFHFTMPAEWAAPTTTEPPPAAGTCQEAGVSQGQDWLLTLGCPDSRSLAPRSSNGGSESVTVSGSTGTAGAQRSEGAIGQKPARLDTAALAVGLRGLGSGRSSPPVGWSAQTNWPSPEPSWADASDVSDVLHQHWAAGTSEATDNEQFQGLRGKRVVVDIAHGPTAMQVLQSCKVLGMVGERGDMRAAQQGQSDADGRGAGGHAFSQFDLAVVGVENATEAIRHAWKGRPLVVLGNKSALPGNLHPLAVYVPPPARHSRLASALVKSMVLLKWLPNGTAPRLSDETISQTIIQNLKNWRIRQAPSSEDSEFARRTSLDNSALCRRNVMPGSSSSGVGPMAPHGSTQARPAFRVNSAQGEQEGGAGNAAASGVGVSSSSCKAMTSVLPDCIPENEVVGSSSCQQLSWTQPRASWATGPLSFFQQQKHQQQQPGVAERQQQLLRQQLQSEHAQADTSIPPLQMPKPPLRILIAEDNKVNQKVVLKVLQRICSSDCQPDVVENGVQVLHALEQKSYDLILMDIHMPEMDGLEASRQICIRFPRPEDRPRIVALSADTMQTLHDRCREAGIEEFIVKPFRVEDLKRVLSVCNHVVASRREETARALAHSNVINSMALPEAGSTSCRAISAV